MRPSGAYLPEEKPPLWRPGPPGSAPGDDVFYGRPAGYPPGISGASDSARYRTLGNSVAIPCAEFTMERITAYLA